MKINPTETQLNEMRRCLARSVIELALGSREGFKFLKDATDQEIRDFLLRLMRGDEIYLGGNLDALGGFSKP